MGSFQRVPMGDRIKTQRRTRGLTQRALADAVGVSPAYLSLIESDKRQIGGKLLRQIAEELGVTTETFTALSDDRLAADLDEVSRTLGEPAEPNASSLVAFSPDWARIILQLNERVLSAEAHSDRIADRFWRDPQSISFAHDILSRITSIRSAAEILADLVDTGGETRARFTRTVVGESERLTTVARQMIAALQEGAGEDAAGADVREVDGYLQDRDYYFPVLEDAVAGLARPAAEPPTSRFRTASSLVERELGSVIDAELDLRAFRTEGAVARARGALVRYAAGALIMPYDAFHDAATRNRYDVDILCDRFGVSFEQAAHRLASLRRPGQEGIPFAFLRVDPAGTISKRLSSRALRLPLFGACPLWCAFGAFGESGRTLTQLADMEGERFLLIARAVDKTRQHHAQPAARFSVMLGAPADYLGDIVYGDPFPPGVESVVTAAGYECRSCSRVSCAQRAHGGAIL
ncbi:short-chain fatty acyl-CoA regulator family protein [Acuticoccus sp. MNP-M23]|uniref:helix-turn-helix domain-containing protein n=1 Tax=Acuticoccus sp. MNP-M23 TaxID=3072793 RepID=UPI002814CB27|nr:short-chain fatty acyl-CoA regulator family protein [Acuticoccus sp. MNP-M23]WMS41215.1 short-chain fatty acyl-CoA regulator family protein [Acuticoccus sp. MNP-M23]